MTRRAMNVLSAAAALIPAMTLVALMIITTAGAAYATPWTYQSVNDDDGGGYYAVAEYGPKYALSTIQGTVNKLTSRATYDYTFAFGGPSFQPVTIELTYSLLTEAFAYDLASTQSYASISLKGTVSGITYLVDSISSLLTNEPGNHVSSERIDIVEIITLPSSNWEYTMTLSTEVHGQTWFDPATAYFSASSYADPTIQILSSGFTLNENYSSTVYTTTIGDPVPEPSTLSFLGIGIVGLAGAAARRRYKNKKADH